MILAAAGNVPLEIQGGGMMIAAVRSHCTNDQTTETRPDSVMCSRCQVLGLPEHCDVAVIHHTEERQFRDVRRSHVLA